MTRVRCCSALRHPVRTAFRMIQYSPGIPMMPFSNKAATSFQHRSSCIYIAQIPPADQETNSPPGALWRWQQTAHMLGASTFPTPRFRPAAPNTTPPHHHTFTPAHHTVTLHIQKLPTHMYSFSSHHHLPTSYGHRPTCRSRRASSCSLAPTCALYLSPAPQPVVPVQPGPRCVASLSSFNHPQNNIK